MMNIFKERKIISKASYRVIPRADDDNALNNKISKWVSQLTRCWKGPKFIISPKTIKNKVIFSIKFEKEGYTQAFARWLGGIVRGDSILYALPV